jgi:hypothetical protein
MYNSNQMGGQEKSREENFLLRGFRLLVGVLQHPRFGR